MKPSDAEAPWSVAEHRFDAAHPTAAGHFPGNPIIPGALLLDQVLRVIGLDTADVPVAKFLAPVRPGEPIEIRWRENAAGTIAFECRTGDTLALSGSARGVP